MKTSLLIQPALRRGSNLLVLVGIVVALSSGCATRRQVQTIVAESNAALLVAQLPDVELAGVPGANRPPDPAAISKKIDDFIEAHPDQKVANSALRVRQGILLIVYEKYELARSAFADATELKTDRDKALKSNSETIIWWWQHAGLDNWNEPVRNDAAQLLPSLDKEIAKVNGSPEIRDYLAELRARMAFQLARNLQVSQGKRDVFIVAMNRYGATLTTNDIAAIKSNNLAPKASAISPDEKRRLRALGIIEKAKVPAEGLRVGGQAVNVSDLDPLARGFGELVLSQ